MLPKVLIAIIIQYKNEFDAIWTRFVRDLRRGYLDRARNSTVDPVELNGWLKLAKSCIISRILEDYCLLEIEICWHELEQGRFEKLQLWVFGSLMGISRKL